MSTPQFVGQLYSRFLYRKGEQAGKCSDADIQSTHVLNSQRLVLQVIKQSLLLTLMFAQRSLP